MIWIRIFVCILFLVSCSKASQSKPPQAIDGILDLSEWTKQMQSTDQRTSGQPEPISLSGEWEFYWNEVFYSEDFQNLDKKELIESKRRIISVPRSWNSFIPDGQKESVGGIGYATYRLRIIGVSSEKIYYLKFLAVLTAYRIYLNGELFFESGKFGTNINEHKPNFISDVIQLPKSGKTDFELIVHVSNFSFAKGGLINTFEIGGSRELNQKRLARISMDTFLVGAFFIMSIYHFGLYLIRRSDRSPLYFGIFTFLLAIRPLIMMERYYLYFFESIPWAFVVRVEYLVFYLSVAFIVLFVFALFPAESNRKITNLIVMVSCIFSGIVLLTSPYLFSHTLTIMQLISLFTAGYLIVTVVKALKRGREGANVFFIGTFVFVSGITNDILFEKKIIQTGVYVYFGLFFFVFSQAYLLSARFSKAFKEEEKAKRYSEEQRTQLALANLEIEKLSKAKDEFLANLSHELKTPLSVVYAYSEMLGANKNNPSKIERYSAEIYANAEKLNLYVSDLILVTEIESSLELQTSRVEINELLEESIQSLRPLQENKAIELEFVQSEKISIICDPILLKKAITAILKNAIVYNKEMGRVEVSLKKENSFLEIKIADTGIGIPEDLLEKVFEKFFRVDSTFNYEVSGVGIGLFLAKRILELHKGYIRLTSSLDKGTVVTSYLPIG